MVDRLLGKKVVGIKQVTKALNNGKGKKLYLAKNAEKKLILPLEKLAKEKNVEVEYVDTMNQLGKLCAIDVGAASTLILKDS